MLLRQDLLELPQHTTGYRSVEDQRVGWRRPQDGLEQQILGPATPVPNSPEAGRGCHLQPVPATVSLSFKPLSAKIRWMDGPEMRGDHLAANPTGLGHSLFVGRLRKRPERRCSISCCKLPKNTNGSPRRSRTAQPG